jgi:lipoprotein-anchoring transpeptidase ErfK/SrfK
MRPDGRPGEPLVLVPVNPGPTPTPATVPVVVPAPQVPPAASNRLAGVVPAPGARPASPYDAFLPGFDEGVLAAQVALARRGLSAGPLDGVPGSQTRAALRAFQEAQGLPANGGLDAATAAQLVTNGIPFTNYVITAEDVARLLPIGSTWLAKSQQPRLDYETLLELVAEQSLSNPKLVRALNPQVDWSRAGEGTVVRLVAVNIDPPPSRAALLRIHTAGRYLQAFDAEGRLLAHFPCSIAARVEKRPVGETLSIVAVAPRPNYTFDPAVFPESPEARQLGRKLILPPGPNNPVGTVWFSLDKPGYGIHGTPRPEEVGRTESHGCFRLANWNAEHLLKLAGVGLLVQVEP